MDIKKSIEIFENMDITKPIDIGPNIQMGAINVQDTAFSLRCSMVELKKNIGKLSNSAKLNYLNGLNLEKPKSVFFNIDNNRVNDIQQSFFQIASDWYDFIEAYKAHLQDLKILIENGNNQVKNDLEGTIENLTEAKLIEYGFEQDVIENFFNPNIKQYEHTFYGPNGIIFASGKEGKIHSGFAGARKVYFKPHFVNFPYKYPQLTAEYHEIKLAEHINSKKRLLGSFYDEDSEKRLFIDKQILWVKNEIGQNLKAKESCKYNYQLDEALSLKSNIEVLESYSAFLNKLLLINVQPSIEITKLIPTEKIHAQTTPGNVNPHISNGKITDLYNFLHEKNVICEINCPDFLSCFDFNNSPNIFPTVKYKKMFVYALSLIDGVNTKIALQNFNIKNFDQYKSKANDPKKISRKQTPFSE